MDEIKREYRNRVKVVFVKGECLSQKDNKELVDYFGIVTIPTQVLLNKEGKEYFRHNGYLSAEELSKYFR